LVKEKRTITGMGLLQLKFRQKVLIIIGPLLATVNIKIGKRF
jgi:hypothetical protein